MATTSVRPVAWTGAVDIAGGPPMIGDPSWPKVFNPQPQTVPSYLSARLKLSPPATANAPVKPVTRTGVALEKMEPSPSSPPLLSPHAHTVVSVLIARL